MRGVVVALAAAVSGYQLHLKAGPDGRSQGDCPFAHACLLAARHKSLDDIEVIAHAADAKPTWLLDRYEGKLPALVVVGADGARDEVVTESRVIVRWLEERHPSPSLYSTYTPGGTLNAAEEAAAPVFGAFARYCKNVDAAADGELRANLLRVLCALDAHLAVAARPFAAGGALSTIDCFLLPQLYHLKVAGGAFKDFEIPPAFEALHAYIAAMFEMQLLYETAPKPAMVRWGWANARGDVAAAAAAAEELAAAMEVA